MVGLFLNTNPGRQPYLSREEVNELMDFVISCSRLGYGLMFCLLLRKLYAKREENWMGQLPMDGRFVFIRDSQTLVYIEAFPFL